MRAARIKRAAANDDGKDGKKMRFRFKQEMFSYYGKHRGLDAQKVGEELSQIGNGNIYDAARKPESIVERARSKTSSMHGGFDWDVQEAAHNWWLTQARHLVGAIITEVVDADGNKHETRAFVSVQGNQGFEYQRIDKIMGDADMRLQVVRNALDDWRIFARRYQSLKDILGDLGQIEQTLVRELSRLQGSEQHAA